jgi:hypothetical protein
VGVRIAVSEGVFLLAVCEDEKAEKREYAPDPKERTRWSEQSSFEK